MIGRLSRLLMWTWLSVPLGLEVRLWREGFCKSNHRSRWRFDGPKQLYNPQARSVRIRCQLSQERPHRVYGRVANVTSASFDDIESREVPSWLPSRVQVGYSCSSRCSGRSHEVEPCTMNVTHSVNLHFQDEIGR